MKEISIGDKVKLTSIPEWLTHDLPEDEKVKIMTYIGKVAEVTDIDDYGYYWIGFGNISTNEDGFSTYIGNSFCVTSDCLKVVHRG